MVCQAGNCSMSLRIAQVAPLWLPIRQSTYGGIELLLQLLCDGLVERSHDVTLFASADSSTKAKLVPVVETNLCDLMAEGRAWCYEYYINSMLAEIASMQHEFDLIHYHCFPAWLPTSTLIKARALFTMHGVPHVDDEWTLSRWPNIAVSGVSRSQMRELASKLGRSFPIVYNGCDFAAYDPCYEAGRYLAFIGRFSPGKNPRGAIQVAQDCGLPIILAGQPLDGKEQAYFESEIKPLINGESVRWIGPLNHSHKVAFLREASALIFPVEGNEPFGLVMIEAMACGTPVVARRRGSVEEVVDMGVTGFHAASPDDLSPLVAKAIALDRREIRRHAELRFDYRLMVGAYEVLYRDLISDVKASLHALDRTKAVQLRQ
jgi:glycosyltransferase involved in cell wall biosynthesis